MLSNHLSRLLDLIHAQLDETSRGVASSHHLHNVQCGIDNILSILEHSKPVLETSAELSCRASNYITRHDLISSQMSDMDISQDAERLRAAREALVRFRSALEQSRPNARARMLGLI
jgi:hypothetical protein